MSDRTRRTKWSISFPSFSWDEVLLLLEEREQRLAEEREQKRRDESLSCGEPGHDYTDHLVEYEGGVRLDINLPEGARGKPITGPSWTQVPEDKQDISPRKWDFAPYPISGSFAEQRAEAALLEEE